MRIFSSRFDEKDKSFGAWNECKRRAIEAQEEAIDLRFGHKAGKAGRLTYLP